MNTIRNYLYENNLPHINKLKFDLANEVYLNVGNYSKILDIFNVYNDKENTFYIWREVSEAVKNNYE